MYNSSPLFGAEPTPEYERRSADKNHSKKLFKDDPKTPERVKKSSSTRSSLKLFKDQEITNGLGGMLL